MTACVKSLQLHNICQYTDLQVDVRTGLNAVVGPNGSGKSNLCRALVYGLTGLVDGLWGTQQTLQKDGTADPGHVTVTFEHDGKLYRVRRHSASGKLFPDWVEEAGGARVATRNAEVNAFMSDVFGIPVRLMFQVCWARQGELAQLITAPAAIVSEMLSQVFDTRRLEKIREKLKIQLDTIAVPPADCKEKLKQWMCHPSLMADDKALQEEVDKARRERDELKARYDAEREHYNGAVIQVASAELARIRAELEDRIAEPTDEDLKLLGDMDPDAVADELRPAIADRESRLSEFRSSLMMVDARLEAAKSHVENMQHQLDRLILEVEKKPGDECGFCKGEIKDIDKYIMEVCKAFGCMDIDGLKTSLDQQKAVKADSERRKACLVAGIQQFEEKLAEERRLHDAAVRCRDARRHEKLIERALELEALIPDKDAPRRLRCMEAGLNDAELRLSKAEQNLNTVLSQRDMARQMVVEMERSCEAYDRSMSAREALCEIREALSQSRAQARYMSGMIERLNVKIGWYMRQTGLPFTLQLSPSARTFSFTNADGSEHPAVHLSGAQRAMSAVAVQMALFSVMRPRMNLYVIDEPTEALDDSNKRVMAAMFARMNDMLPAVSGTMFIVTRDMPIIESCGNVIEVGGTTE